MVRARPAVHINELPVRTRQDAVEHVIKRRAAPRIRLRARQHGPDPSPALLVTPFMIVANVLFPLFVEVFPSTYIVPSGPIAIPAADETE